MHACTHTHLHTRTHVNTYGPLVALFRSSLLAARSRSLSTHALLAFCLGRSTFPTFLVASHIFYFHSMHPQNKTTYTVMYFAGKYIIGGAGALVLAIILICVLVLVVFASRENVCKTGIVLRARQASGVGCMVLLHSRSVEPVTRPFSLILARAPFITLFSSLSLVALRLLTPFHPFFLSHLKVNTMAKG